MQTQQTPNWNTIFTGIIATAAFAALVVGAIFWLARLDADVQHLQRNVTDLQDDVSSLQDDVASLQADVADVKENIAEINETQALILELLESYGDALASHTHNGAGQSVFPPQK